MIYKFLLLSKHDQAFCEHFFHGYFAFRAKQKFHSVVPLHINVIVVIQFGVNRAQLEKIAGTEKYDCTTEVDHSSPSTGLSEVAHYNI